MIDWSATAAWIALAISVLTNIATVVANAQSTIKLKELDQAHELKIKNINFQTEQKVAVFHKYIEACGVIASERSTRDHITQGKR